MTTISSSHLAVQTTPFITLVVLGIKYTHYIPLLFDNITAVGKRKNNSAIKLTAPVPIL